MLGADKARLLVVATRDETAEIRGLLAAEGLPEPVVGDGGDETLASYRTLAPHVVILSAHLERGDARSLASAIKGGEHRFVRIILVGEQDGPIRNALDAADFEVDRFLGRPLSRKALVFAVHSCAAAAQKDEAERVEAPPRAATRPPPIPERRRPAEPESDVIELEPASDIVELEADPAEPFDERPDSVSGEIEVGEPTPPPREPTLIVPPPRTGAPALVAPAATAPTAVSSTDPAEPPEDQETSPGNDEVVRSKMIDEAMEAAIAEFVNDAIRTVGDAVPTAAPHEETQRAAQWREPTLILTGRNQSPPPPVADDLEDLDDLDDLDDLGSLESLDDLADFDDETTNEREVHRRQTTSHAIESDDPPGGGLARELRRKMSAMAERLFPERVATGDSQVTVSLPHDAHTEIDLGALEQTTGDTQAAPYRGIGNVETFADTNPMIAAAGSDAAAESHKLATSGQLGSSADDIASLISRLHHRKFSGALSVSRGEVKKTIYFDGGRPVFAASNDAHDRMGDLLYREGKISREQHARTCERVVSSGRRMGELLVEMGFLKPRELLPAVRRHIEDIIYSVFAWRDGAYLIANREPPSERIRLSRHPAALVVEGVRRKYDLDRLLDSIGSEDAVLSPRSPNAIEAVAHVADLGTEERAMLAMFDGARTLGQVVVESGIDELTCAQLAFALVALGAVEVVFRGDDEVTQTGSGRSTALVGETDIAIDRQRVLAKLALVEEADYFMLLGVRRDASRFEIQRAYEAARRDYARDAFPEPVADELGDELDEINELIEEAYRILLDDGMRRAYLDHLSG